MVKNKLTPDFACLSLPLTPRNRSTPDFACLSLPILPRNRSGQMKIQQMIFMIIAVVLLFILVGLFFLSITLNELKKSSSELGEKSSMLLVSKLANSPEFSCGNAFGTSRINCIDFDKLMALKKISEEYSDFWGVAKIEIRKVYPESDLVCTDSNYPDCGIVKILDKNVNILPYSYNFVSLCRKEATETEIYNKCELARLMIASQDKT